jgi:inhibitor of KinA
MQSEEISYPRFQLASDHSLLVTFGNGISRSNHRDVVRFFNLLQAEPNPATRNIHPAYSSVLISFDPLVTHPRDFDLYARGLSVHLGSVAPTTAHTVEIPVCYDEPFAPDLVFVASHNKLTVEEVVRHHSSVEYLVYFVGFAPGFPYLGDLPRQLATPRLPSPRVKVPEGSVAIGGSQTGIYSIESPGGWRVIGRTPWKLFRPDKRPPTILEIGDAVRFKRISAQEFHEFRESIR